MRKRMIGIFAEFIVLWYAGAMLVFFPFLADDFGAWPAAFSGLLVCFNLALCTSWIIDEIQKPKVGETGNRALERGN